MAPDLVMVGDSIRMGYEATVRAALPHLDIAAPEANGGDSGNVLEHLDEWILDLRPRLVHLNCGLHDIKKPFDTGVAQVGLDDYRANLVLIFEHTRLAGIPLAWATTTPVDQDRHHANKGFDRFTADLNAYNDAARRLAVTRGLPIDDLHAVVEAAGRDRLLGADGVHFTDAGYRLLGQAVADFVRPLLA